MLGRKTTHSPFGFVFTDLGCTEGRHPSLPHPGGLDWILRPRGSKKLSAGAFDLRNSVGWIEIVCDSLKTDLSLRAEL